MKNLQIGIVALSAFYSPFCLLAQVVPDQSSINSSVFFNGKTFVVEGGKVAGNNLFHSLQEFSIPAGSGVHFNNSMLIQNIFTRITGHNPSHINGLLQVNGRANLFLLNPNGLIFGPQTTLRLGGSFFATTANKVTFEDGNQFSTTSESFRFSNTQPVTLTFLESGSITINGRGHQITEIPLLNPFNIPDHPGLKITSGNIIALLGGDINIDGGVITGNDGHIEIGSIRDGFIKLDLQENNWKFDYSNVQNWANINLQNLGLININSQREGSLFLSANNITIDKGGFILSQNLGDNNAANVTLNAQDKLTIQDDVENNFSPLAIGRSSITMENLNQAKGGNINISARNLQVDRGGIIGYRNFSDQNAGNINVEIEDTIHLRGFSPLNIAAFTAIISTGGTTGTGQIANISIKAEKMTLFDGAQISTVTRNGFQGGSLDINIEESVVISGVVPELETATTLSTGNTSGTGQGGKFFLSAPEIKIKDGARITSFSLGNGDSGTLQIQASESIELSRNSTSQNFLTGISSSVDLTSPEIQAAFALPSIPSGNAGNLIIQTPQLIIQEGASIAVQNKGRGDAGNLQIRAEVIELNSGIISAESSQGRGGSIFIESERIQIVNNSQITGIAQGFQPAGNISLKSPFISLNESQIIATTESGNGGNIVLESNDLRFSSSIVSATANQLGDGGNISVNSDRLVVFNNSSITTQAFQGQGGNIDIFSDLALISNDSQISASSELGINGVVNIDAEIFQIKDITLLPLSFSEQSLLTNSCLTSNNENLARFNVQSRGGLPQRSQINSFLIPLSDSHQMLKPTYIRLPKGKKLAQQLIQTENGWKLIGNPNSVTASSTASCHS